MDERPRQTSRQLFVREELPFAGNTWGTTASVLVWGKIQPRWWGGRAGVHHQQLGRCWRDPRGSRVGDSSQRRHDPSRREMKKLNGEVSPRTDKCFPTQRVGKHGSWGEKVASVVPIGWNHAWSRKDARRERDTPTRRYTDHNLGAISGLLVATYPIQGGEGRKDGDS